MVTGNLPPFISRVKWVQQTLEPQQIILFTQPAEIQYLTGFNQFLLPYEREALLLCTPTDSTLFHPHFLHLIHQPFLQYYVGCTPYDLVQYLKRNFSSRPSLEILYDPSSLLVTEFSGLQSLTMKLTALPTRKLTEMRMIKDESELVALRQAAAITQKVLTETLTSLKSGVTERELAHHIDHLFLHHGGESSAFPTIVAFGAHSALPHHQPSDRALQNNEAVLIDCGARYQGYCGDMTRTVWFGSQPSDEFVKIKLAVDHAYTEGIDLIRQKVSSKQPLLASAIDARCRSAIGEAGYRDHFIHTSGHSLGLEIHEPPSISSSSTQELQANMVITLEPGIYLPDSFGYRYENTLLIKDQEVIELTNTQLSS